MDEMSFKIYKASDKKNHPILLIIGKEKNLVFNSTTPKASMFSELLGAEQLLIASIPNAPNQFCVCNKFNTS